MPATVNSALSREISIGIPDFVMLAMEVDGVIPCAKCGLYNRRKGVIKCFSCNMLFHRSCVSITRAEAEVIPRWNCAACRGLQLAGPVQPPEPPQFDLEGYVGGCRNKLRVLKRIPRGAVISVADALHRLIGEVIEHRTPLAWTKLLSFSFWGLRCPSVGGGERQVSLATRVKQQVFQFVELESLPDLPAHSDFVAGASRTTRGDEQAYLRRRVAAKFAEADISGAVRELASSDGLAPQDDITLADLRSKHPPAPNDLELPDPPSDVEVPMVASEADTKRAINSFRPGSSGGPDGLRPSHLRALIGHASAEAGSRFLTTLTRFINMILKGEVPGFALATFYGATLCALNKKGGGVRPIAVGNTFRRLATKIGARPLSAALGSELSPVQLGFSCKGGCEAAVHAARRYLRDCSHRRVLLKIDMRNAFNSLRRDKFLAVARSRAAGLYRLLWQAYSSPTKLFFGEEGLKSESGIQQGDPFGPALFALAVDEAARGVNSEFNVWYLDDATLGGTPEQVLEDVPILLDKLNALGLEVNSEKCELAILNHDEQNGTEGLFRALLPDVRVVSADDCTLLGAPIAAQGISGTLLDRREDLDRLISRLEVCDNHQAFILLRNAFAIPKLQYILRASPAYSCLEELRAFDKSLRVSLSRVTNVSLDDSAWVQAGLPVALGGLGCRRAEDIALPAFVASLYSVNDLVDAILSRINMAETNELVDAVAAWTLRGESLQLPESKASQKSWDSPLMEISRENLLLVADQVSRARLLAAARKESGAWLNALPVPSLGTQLDPETLRVSIALRIGADVCQPHSCRCGRLMDARGLHGLSCRFSAGHFTLNNTSP